MNLSKIAMATGAAIATRQAVQGIQKFTVDDLLCGVGLERRRSPMSKLIPAVGWLGLGAVVGAGVALLCAPSSGKELRSRVSDKLGQVKDEVKGQVNRELRSFETKVQETIENHKPQEAARGNGY